MTDYIIIVSLAAFWGGVALWLKTRRTPGTDERRPCGFRFANDKED